MDDNKITSNIQQTNQESEKNQSLDNSESAANVASSESAANVAGSENSTNSEQIIDFSEEAEEAERKQKKKKKKIPVLKIIILSLVSILVLIIAFSVWNRWFRYSDSTDIVSNWQISGTNTTIKIDKKQIYLDKDTIFNYELDEGAKLIYLKTGDYSGTCHYRFSGDRCQLALIDSGDMNAIASAWSDIGWFFDSLKCKIGGVDISPAYTKDSKQVASSSDAGIEEIIANGKGHSILLDKISTQKTADNQ